MHSLFILLILMGVRSEIADAQSIDFTRKSPTRKQYNEKQSNCFRVIYQLYEKHTADPASIQPMARAFLDRYIDYVSTALQSGYTDPEIRILIKEGESVLKNGSTDPLVRRTVARLCNLIKQPLKAKQYAAQANHGFGNGPYPSGMKLFALMEFNHAVTNLGQQQPQLIEQLRVQACRNIADWFTFVQYDSGLPWEVDTKRFAFDQHLIATVDCMKSKDAFNEGVAVYAERLGSDPVIVAMIEGDLLRRTAWEFRGKKYFSKTDPTRWANYEELRK